MAAEVDAITETPVEKETTEIHSEDEVENGQAEPLNQPVERIEVGEIEVEESRELVPFLFWKIEKRNEKKIIRTVVLYFGFFSLGLSMAITGPTLLDLGIVTRSSTDDIAYVLTGRSIGGLVGGIITSVFVNYINNWVILGYAMIMAGILAITFPLYKILGVMIFMHVLWGLHGCMFDAGGNVTLLLIWGKDHGPWMQALHCIFGFGALVGPLVAKPFLAEILDSVQNPKVQVTSDVYEEGNEATSGLIDAEGNITSRFSGSIPEGETDVFYAYLIVGIIVICAGLSFFMIFIATPPRNIIKTKEEKKKEEETDEETKPDDPRFKIPFLVGVFIFFLSYCMVEGNYGNFLFAYAVEGLKWTKAMGAAVTTVFWTSFTVGRAFGIVLVKRVSPQILLGVDCLLSVVSLLPLLLFAHSHSSVLWISSIALGLTMSTIFATGITWTERYVNLSGGVGTIFLIAGASGEIVGPLLLSALYKRYGMEAFVYIMFTAAAVTFVFYVVLQAVGYKKGERYIDKSKDEETVKVKEEVEDEQLQQQLQEEKEEEEDAEKEKEIEIELENMLKRHMERDKVQDDESEVEV